MDDETQIKNAYREMYRAMLDARTDRLGALLDTSYTLTHMTGLRQPRAEWLAAIDSGEMRYHDAREESVQVEITGQTAVLVGRSLVSATIYGARGTWPLQLTTRYLRRNDRWVALRTIAATY